MAPVKAGGMTAREGRIPMVEQSGELQTLYLRAVRRHVSDAIESRVIRSSSEYTSELLRTYPNCPLSQLDIERAVVGAAAALGVSLPISRFSKKTAQRGKDNHR
jgi:hypothetical protein